MTRVLQQQMEALLHLAQEEYETGRNNTDRWWLPSRLDGTAPTPERAAELDLQERQTRAERRSQP